MSEKIISENLSSTTQEENKQNDEEDLMIQSLPVAKTWDGTILQQYQGFWYPSAAPVKAIISFQNHFKARDSDIFLLTLPKSGTTWLKALVFSIVNRNKIHPTQSPLLASAPTDLVPTIEINVYTKRNQVFDLEKYGKDLDAARIFASHVPFVSFPSSIKNSICRIIYLCRNPLDQFISFWHFFMNYVVKMKKGNDDFDSESMMSMEEGFDQFCRGIYPFGPFLDHILCHWKLSLENPERVLFMKYEDLKKDTGSNLRKIAEFLGYPFSEDEIKKGVDEEIESLCSFDTLKNLDVNKQGKSSNGMQNEAYFRKGQVGDWKNYISPSMADRMMQVVEQKLGDSGLKFDLN